MGKFIVVPFEPAHYLEAVSGAPYEGDPEASAEVYYKAGPAWTGLVDGAVVACAGIMLLWPGLGEAWAVWTPRGRAHIRSIHRAVRDGMRDIVDDHHLRRVQAKVVEGFWEGRLWANHLGFNIEARMQKYGPNGETFDQLVYFPEEP